MLFLLRPRQTWMPYALARDRQQQAVHHEELDRAYASTRRLPPASPSTSVDVVSQLKELAALHDSGALSDDEFATSKARLLDG